MVTITLAQQATIQQTPSLSCIAAFKAYADTSYLLALDHLHC